MTVVRTWILALIVLAAPHVSAQSALAPLCPLKVVSSTGIGPLTFQSALADLKKRFPKGVQNGDQFAIEGLHIQFCDGKAVDIWAELNEMGVDCLNYMNRNIPKKAPLKKVRRWFGGCPSTSNEGGLTYYECGQGVRLGTMAEMVTQIRMTSALKARCRH